MFRKFRQWFEPEDSPIWTSIRERARTGPAVTPGWPIRSATFVASDQAAFRQRVSEAAAWCLNQKLKQLWNPLLKPSAWTGDCLNLVCEGMISEVCDRRSTLMREHTRASPVVPDGRLLRYAPQENVCDGASAVLSKGFFDPNDCPPWDTWVWFDGYYLVSLRAATFDSSCSEWD